MKNIILMILTVAGMQPICGATITTTTTTLTVGGNAVTVHMSPVRTPGYYRLAYDVAAKKVKALVFSVGITETINGLYCADTYAEIQAFAAANSLTDLPMDPNARH
jgi:hypothetical protein